jgi:flagellar protein FliS
LYLYITQKLTLANARNDDAALVECTELLRPIREAWAAITPPPGNDRPS